MASTTTETAWSIIAPTDLGAVVRELGRPALIAEERGLGGLPNVSEVPYLDARELPPSTVVREDGPAGVSTREMALVVGSPGLAEV